MKRALLAAFSLLCLINTNAFGRGVSPYLPLNLDPETERQVERVLMLADKPVLARPIAAATVLDALPKACLIDPISCAQVRGYLRRFMSRFGVTVASLEAAAANGADKTLPNDHGMTNDSAWRASASGYYQPYDHALVSLGAVAYEGETVPTGSMVSLGFDRAQLDVGYRDHWWSPMAGSSMLISTEAATMPSVTLSNYLPFTRFAFQYEAFIASMSKSDAIQFGDGFTSGHPRLAGFHFSMEPASGWSLGVSRLLQYGGGERPGSFKDMLKAFFNPSGYDNTNPDLTSDEQVGNQLASITSEFLFPGRTPFTVYFEYAGEDTSNGKNYLLGNAALSAGIRLPRLWNRFELTYEVSEWQNAWYTNSVYGDGLTNKGHVLGHWGGDDREFGDEVGARSQMLLVGWMPSFGGLVELRYRTLSNQSYSAVAYERAQDATLRYSRQLQAFTVGAEVFAGQDVFGASFSRLTGFVSLALDSGPQLSSGAYEPAYGADESAEVFLDAGVSSHHTRVDLDAISTTTQTNTSPHFAIGARRAVSDRSDLGARLELDEVDGHTLIGVRAIDYRYRFANPLALSVFVGASRYDVATPAYGLSYGLGLQWRDIFPKWDAGLDLRTAKKVARDHLLADDPSSALRPDSFYTIDSYTLTLTKRF